MSSEKPTEPKLPLGHEFAWFSLTSHEQGFHSQCLGCIEGLCHLAGCCQPRSAHEPVKEPMTVEHEIGALAQAARNFVISGEMADLSTLDKLAAAALRVAPYLESISWSVKAEPQEQAKEAPTDRHMEEAQTFNDEECGDCTTADHMQDLCGCKARTPILAALLAAESTRSYNEGIEAAAQLMQGPGAGLVEFNSAQTFCRWVDHAQDMCDCPERAAAIRGLKR